MFESNLVLNSWFVIWNTVLHFVFLNDKNKPERRALLGSFEYSKQAKL